MKDLLAQVEKEERDFTKKHGVPPRINEFSEKLRNDIEQKVFPEVVNQGLEFLKTFLRAF